MEDCHKIKRMIVLQISGNSRMSVKIPGNPVITHDGGKPSVHSIVIEKERIQELIMDIESSGLLVEVFHNEEYEKKPDIDELMSNLKYIECVECSLSSSNGKCMIENPDVMMADLLRIDGSVKSINRCPIYGRCKNVVD